LKDQTSPLKRAREAHILKFRHIELAINGNMHSKIFLSKSLVDLVVATNTLGKKGSFLDEIVQSIILQEILDLLNFRW